MLCRLKCTSSKPHQYVTHATRSISLTCLSSSHVHLPQSGRNQEQGACSVGFSIMYRHSVFLLVGRVAGLSERCDPIIPINFRLHPGMSEGVLNHMFNEQARLTKHTRNC